MVCWCVRNDKDMIQESTEFGNDAQSYVMREEGRGERNGKLVFWGGAGLAHTKTQNAGSGKSNTSVAKIESNRICC